MRVGEVVGERFVLGEKAGFGGMGTVYRANDRTTDRAVALKLLTAEGAENLARFEREAEMLLELSHPGIARYVAHGREANGARYLVMEWLEGESLAHRIERGPFAVNDALVVVKRVAEALGAAHARGVVHRDVKPSNVILVGGDVARATLIDFGIAREIGSELTAVGQLIGTPGYLSPEQVRGLELDPRSDVFALGCLLFKCLTQRLPFEAEELLALLLRLVLEEAPRPSSLRSDLPEPIDDLVASMLAKPIEERPRDGAVVAEHLDAILRDLAVPAAPKSLRALTLGERRLTSLVLARAPNDELAGPTSNRSRSISADLLRELERDGARLDRLVDGSTLLTLAGGGARDEAVRAARCALLLRRAIRGASFAVVSGRGEAEGALPVGEIIDRGVALLRLAEEGAIRLDPLTAGLLEARFEIAPDAAGFVLRAERAFTLGARELHGRATSFVGRDAEMLRLTALVDEAQRSGSARAALVVGHAGAGKSRLRHELVQRIWTAGRTEVWFASGDPVATGSPFSLLAALVNGAIGVAPGDAPPVRAHKLSARLEGLFEGDRRRRIHEFLGALTETPVPFAPSVELEAAREERVLLGDQQRRAFEDLVAACASCAPLLIVIDDVQGVDAPSLASFDAAMRNLACLPWTVIGLARPELDERSPGLWEGHDVDRFELGPLSQEAANAIVEHALGAIPTAARERIVGAADGNPLYLEELIRAAARGDATGVPETVLALAEARLERLSAGARRLARAGSVFGRIFTDRGVAKLLGGSSRLEAELAELVDTEIVDAGDAMSVPEPVSQSFSFRNGAVRDAAYAMLTSADRALGHRLAGEFLVATDAREAARLAEHFELGGAPEEASLWYRRAAAQAISGSDYTSAIALTNRGLASATSDEMRGALDVLAAEAHRHKGDMASAQVSADAAVARLPMSSPLWCVAAAELSIATQRMGNFRRLESLGSEILTYATREDMTNAFRLAAARTVPHFYYAGLSRYAAPILDIIGSVTAEDRTSAPVVAARILTAEAARAATVGDVALEIDLITEAVDTFEAAGSLRDACAWGTNLASVLAKLGEYEASEALLGKWIPVAESLGLAAQVGTMTTNSSLNRLRLGAADEACALLEAALATHRRCGDRRMEAGALNYLAFALTTKGDLATALLRAREAMTIAGPHVPMRLASLAVIADLELRLGDLHGAVATLAEAERTASGNWGGDGAEAFVIPVRAEAMRQTGDLEGARSLVAGAKTELLARAAGIRREDQRRSLLERVPEHARLLELARELGV